MAKSTNEVIKFLKVRDVISPSRAYEYDAGIDFYVPKFSKEFIEDLKEKNGLVFGGNDIDYSPDYSSGTGTLVMTGGSCSTVTIASADTSKVKYELSDDNDTQIKYDEEKGKNYFNLAPHSRIMIPSGVKSRMSEPGRALIASNKSGMATKNGLVFGAQVVDYTYKGEIHLSLINTSTKLVRIYEDMKILQFVETPVFFSKIEMADVADEPMMEETFYKGLQDDRGSDGFDSTQNKK